MPLLRDLAYRLPVARTLLNHRNDLINENAELKRRLAEVPMSRPEPPPRPPHPTDALSCTVNPAHYTDPEWRALHHDLSRYSRDEHCFQNISGEIYRKGWEWTQCLYGLRHLGMLAPHHRALGVGVGRECVVFYLADQIAFVTATDLYDTDNWARVPGGREADLDLLENAKRHCPATVDFAKIQFESQDGTRLSYADDAFDFAWSLSSIEHFGGHAAAAQAVREMARVVRPGGILAIATEMLLLDEQSHPEFFTKRQIMAELIAPFPQLELVGPVDFDTLPRDYLIDSIILPNGADRRRRHVVLNNGWVQWTSVILFLRVLG